MKSILEILSFQKEQLNSFGNGIKFGRQQRPKVSVSMMLIYNEYIFDLLTEKRIRKLSLDSGVNIIHGSPTTGKVHSKMLEASVINTYSLADIKTIIRAAQ